MNVNELLDTIEDLLEESTGMPLSGGKRIVDVEQIRDYLDEVRAADKELPFILASCHDKDDYEQEAMRRGATLCMDKMKGPLL